MDNITHRDDLEYRNP